VIENSPLKVREAAGKPLKFLTSDEKMNANLG
jgi:hypothetical protein